MSSFDWGYFFRFLGGMLVLYWVVVLLAVFIRSRLEGRDPAAWFGEGRGFSGYLAAALAGAVTPFCSCTTVPVFVVLLESELPLGCAVSFLIASPTVNPPAVALFVALFGWRLTLLYVGACLAIAVLGGILLSHSGLRRYLIEVLYLPEDGPTRFTLGEVNRQYAGMLRSLLPVLVVAAVLAALLKGWMPARELLVASSNEPVLAIPAVVLLGGLLYADLGMLLPIGQLLLSAGADTGVVFSFMMAASGVGVPSFLLLSRVFKKELLFLYALTVYVLFTAAGLAISWAAPWGV
ncbi:MAG: permease [Candidatus Riflebacteria bacterium]|nr:permease [Candidatus Riflebacteria bacterium]